MLVVKRFVSSVAQRGKYGLFLRPQASLPELEPRYLECSCCWKCRIPVAGFETLNSSLLSSPGTLCKDDDDKPLDAYYTEEQRAGILLLLNHASEPELATFKLLRGRKSQDIVEHRIQNGPFKTLESVLEVPHLKHKSVVMVFNSILKPPKKEKKKAQLAKFIRPDIDKSKLLEANSIVSIVCGTNRIAWAQVNREMKREMRVLDWREQECPNFMMPTYLASSYLNDVSSVVSHLPKKTDFFVVEKSTMPLQNANVFPIMAHLRTVEAMLFSLLEPRYAGPNPEETTPRVLNMMRNAVGRHFGLMVRESRISGANMVRKMMTESATQNLPRVHIPHNLLVKYSEWDVFQMRRNGGDELSDALLQAVAFYEMLDESKK